MSDLEADTRVRRVAPGRYRGSISPDWTLWAPVGGYVASIALRAVADSCSHPRPVSFSCHYLSVPRYEEVDIIVECLRKTANAASTRVRMTQGDAPVLEALVWTTADDLHGPEAPPLAAPDVPLPEEVDSIALDPQAASGTSASATATRTFWRRLELRTVPVHREEDDAHPLVASWARFREASVFEDQWVDACRELVTLDTSIFPAIALALDGGRYVALSLDLQATFHAQPLREEFFLVTARSTAATSGIVSGSAQTWTREGVLTSTGASQLMCRQVGR